MGYGAFPPPLLTPMNVKACVTVAVAAGSFVVIGVYNKFAPGVCDCSTDLTGKTVVITGGSSGIGKATAISLAKRNAKVIIAGKNKERGMEAANEIRTLTKNQRVTFKPLNLCSFESVRKFSDEVKETEGRLDILVNNAGVAGSGGARLLTEDGCESIMQTNYLGHFLLTLSLKDLMGKSTPSRIINVTSPNYKAGKLDLDDICSWKSFSEGQAYKKSKLAVVLFTTELARRLQGAGVSVNAVNPGLVKTDIVKKMPLFQGFITRMLFMFFGKTPVEGAQTVLHLALSPDLERASGNYFKNCKPKKLAKAAQDQELAGKLFKLSEDIVQYKI